MGGLGRCRFACPALKRIHRDLLLPSRLNLLLAHVATRCRKQQQEGRSRAFSWFGWVELTFFYLWNFLILLFSGPLFSLILIYGTSFFTPKMKWHEISYFLNERCNSDINEVIIIGMSFGVNRKLPIACCWFGRTDHHSNGSFAVHCGPWLFFCFIVLNIVRLFAVCAKGRSTQQSAVGRLRAKKRFPSFAVERQQNASSLFSQTTSQ